MDSVQLSDPSLGRVEWYNADFHGGRSCIFPSFAITLSDRLSGHRLYGAMIPSVLNVFSMQGFLILNCIIGGQALAAVSDRLSDTLGIVIIGIISLAVCITYYALLFI